MVLDQEGGQTRDDVDRVESLLASVTDLVSSLNRLTGQLEREVTRVLAEPGSERLGSGDAATVVALEDEVAHLRVALESRSMIERAKGMIMARWECDEDTAFKLLVARSRNERRKVRDVAAELAASGPGALDRFAGTPSLRIVLPTLQAADDDPESLNGDPTLPR